MNSSLLNSLKLNGLSSTTTFVVWSMIIFLVVLIGGLTLTVILQMQKNTRVKDSKHKSIAPKGF